MVALDPRGYPLAHPRLRAETTTLESWETDEHFDAILCVSTIEHLGAGEYGESRQPAGADERALAKMFELLEAGGLLVLTAPLGRGGYERPRLEELSARLGDRGLHRGRTDLAHRMVSRRKRGRPSRRRAHQGKAPGLARKAGMSVVLDLQGTQSRVHGERGVARYLAQLAAAMETHFPDAVDRYLVNPDVSFRAPWMPYRQPSASARSTRCQQMQPSTTSARPSSPTSRSTGSGPGGRRLRLVVTLYDLIPELFAEHYLADPSARAWYRARLGLVRHADRVLAISHTTARDAIEHLGLRPERVVVAGARRPAFTPPSRARRLSQKCGPTTSHRAWLPPLHRWNRVPEEHRPTAARLCRPTGRDPA